MENKTDRVFIFDRLSTENLDDKMLSHTIKNLRDKEINYNIPFEQIHRIRIKKNNQKYLNNFGIHYKRLFESLIDKFIQKNPIHYHGEIFNNVLFNLNFIRLNKINEISSDSQEILKKLNDYVLDDNFQNQPMILKGPLGSGKTSHIATFASNIYMQLNILKNNFHKHSVLVRFIGLDQKTIYLRSFLKSICQQLFYIKTEIYKQKNIEPVPDKLTALKNYFKKLLTSKFDVNGGKLILIFDSLHNLLKNEDSFKFNWLPNYLHPNCRLIISVSNEAYELIERLNRKYISDMNYIETGKLSYEQAKSMMHKYSQNRNFRFESNQIESILSFIKLKNISSLNFNVLLDNFFYFNQSVDNNFHENICNTVTDWINNLENKFGNLIVKHILSK